MYRRRASMSCVARALVALRAQSPRPALRTSQRHTHCWREEEIAPAAGRTSGDSATRRGRILPTQPPRQRPGQAPRWAIARAERHPEGTGVASPPTASRQVAVAGRAAGRAIEPRRGPARPIVVWPRRLRHPVAALARQPIPLPRHRRTPLTNSPRTMLGSSRYPAHRGPPTTAHCPASAADCRLPTAISLTTDY